jgi:hypothetical protein
MGKSQRRRELMRYAGFGFIVSGVVFIALGIVGLIIGGTTINFVTIGAGLIQIMSGLMIVDSVKKMERY